MIHNTLIVVLTVGIGLVSLELYTRFVLFRVGIDPFDDGDKHDDT